MNETNEKKKSSILKNLLLLPTAGKLFLTAVVTAVIVIAILFGFRSQIFSEQEATRLGFEDIGELATQSAFCEVVNVTEADRELFGISIPFTQSKYIYSYNVEIKAGIDFQEISYTVDDTAKIIQIQLPQTKILSSEIDLDSFKLYHEDESIFQQITLEENNKALSELKRNAEETAISNGLLEEARVNAETILTGFFGQAYDLEEYTIQYSNQ